MNMETPIWGQDLVRSHLCETQNFQVAVQDKAHATSLLTSQGWRHLMLGVSTDGLLEDEFKLPQQTKVLNQSLHIMG